MSCNQLGSYRFVDFDDSGINSAFKLGIYKIDPNKLSGDLWLEPSFCLCFWLLSHRQFSFWHYRFQNGLPGIRLKMWIFFHEFIFLTPFLLHWLTSSSSAKGDTKGFYIFEDELKYRYLIEISFGFSGRQYFCVETFYSDRPADVSKGDSSYHIPSIQKATRVKTVTVNLNHHHRDCKDSIYEKIRFCEKSMSFY